MVFSRQYRCLCGKSRRYIQVIPGDSIDFCDIILLAISEQAFCVGPKFSQGGEEHFFVAWGGKAAQPYNQAEIMELCRNAVF